MQKKRDYNVRDIEVAVTPCCVTATRCLVGIRTAYKNVDPDLDSCLLSSAHLTVG